MPGKSAKSASLARSGPRATLQTSRMPPSGSLLPQQ